MGVRLLPPPRLYRSELGSRESRRDPLLLLELPTAGREQRTKEKREDREGRKEGRRRDKSEEEKKLKEPLTGNICKQSLN